MGWVSLILLVVAFILASFYSEELTRMPRNFFIEILIGLLIIAGLIMLFAQTVGTSYLGF